LEPLGPGPTCSDALAGTLGTTYSETTAGLTYQWFVWPLTSGTLYHMRMTAVDWSHTSIQVWHGPDCSSLTAIVPAPNSIAPCIEYTPGSNEKIYLQMRGGILGDTAYTVVVDSGGC